MNLSPLFKYTAFFFCLLYFVPAMAQSSEEVVFHYLADNQIQQGSVIFSYQLKKAEGSISFREVINLDELNPADLELELKLDKLRWNHPSHDKRFKLIFSNELSEAEGLTKGPEGNAYLRTGTSRQFSYGFLDTKEAVLTPVMSMLAFLVADENTTYEEADAENKIFGFGANIKVFYLLPKYHEAAPEDEYMTLLYGSMISGMNDGFKEMSYNVAEELKNGKLDTSIKEKLDSRRTRSSSSFGTKPSILSKAKASSFDPDQEAFMMATRENTPHSYKRYLYEYPYGNYTKDANSHILSFTPFRITQSEETEEIAEVTFQVHIISFTNGVGYTPPRLQLTNNDDFAVQFEFLDAKTCVIKIPPDRTVDATFKLGQKDTTITLSNSLSIDLITTEKSIATNAIENNASAMEHTPEKGKQSKNKSILAFLLALPFLGAIAYLIHRRYWL